ncbi:hypothetical protein D3C75_804800 [compost metagenome]
MLASSDAQITTCTLYLSDDGTVTYDKILSPVRINDFSHCSTSNKGVLIMTGSICMAAVADVRIFNKQVLCHECQYTVTITDGMTDDTRIF